MLFRSYVGLVSEDLVGLMAPAETADPSALINAQLANNGATTSRDLHHLLLHLTTGPALDRAVNCEDGEGLRAWHSIVERFHPKLRSRNAGILLELMRFDFSGDMLSRIEEFERAIVICQNVRGKVVCSAIKVGMVFNRLLDNELTTHLALKAERLK